MPSNWSEIPTEVLHLIFKPLSNIYIWKDYCNSLLVCKNWNWHLEPLIFADVTISSSLQHAKLNYTLVNSSKGGLVKKIRFTCHYEPDLVQMYRTTFGQIPQLQLFLAPPGFSYLPLIDALLQGQLTELKYIRDPLHYDWASLDNYATCLLFLKDRLESVTLFDTTTDLETSGEEEDQLSMFYERLSRIMEQPHSFTALTVRKRINDNITYVESIMKKCIHLDTLHLFIKPDFSSEETSQWTFDTIRHIITPINTIKSLRIDFTGGNINEFVYYLLYKFLKPDNIYLMLQSYNPLSSTICSQFISYLNSIPRVDILFIPIRTNALEDLMSKQVNLINNDSPPSFGLDLKYQVLGVANDETTDISLLGIKRRRSDMPLLLEVEQFIPRLGLEFIRFLERYGKYVRHMTVMPKVSHLPVGRNSDIISPEYLLSIFQNAPNLETISFYDTSMNDFEWEGDLQQETTLKSIRIATSHIHENLFVNFSRVVKTVHLLYLDNIRYYNIQNECGSYININMESTTVGELEFHHKNTHRGKRYFFLNVNTTRHGDLYYVYDSSKQSQLFESSSKEEFNDTTKSHNTHLSLKFDDLKSILVRYADLTYAKLVYGNQIIR